MYIRATTCSDGGIDVTYTATNALNSSEHVFSIGSGSLSLDSFSIVICKQSFLLSSTLFFITSDGTLNMTKMTLTSAEVENVTQLHYQSLFYLGAGHFVCTNTSITSFTLYSAPLISLTELRSDSLVLSNLFIGNITKNGSGSVFRLASFSKGAVIDGIEFDSDSCADGDGGAISLSIPSGGEVELNSLSFTSCSTSGKGGALFIQLQDESSIVRFNNLSFTPPTSGVGVNIYIECIDGIEASVKGNWSSLGSYDYLSEDSHCYWVQESTTSRASLNTSMVRFIYSLKDVSPSSDLLTVFISPSGTDVRTCGWDDFPCLSISTAVSATSPLNAMLILSAPSHQADTNSTVFASNRSITITSFTSKHVTKVESESKGVFTILDATVSFKSLPFILDNTSLLLSPLFYSSVGNLSLSNITIQPEIVAEHLPLQSPLIVVCANSSLTIDLLYSLNVKLSELNGTVVHAELGQSNKLSFTNCSFTSCSTVNGYGGAVYIHIHADSSLSNLSFSFISFSNCSDKNTHNLSS